MPRAALHAVAPKPNPAKKFLKPGTAVPARTPTSVAGQHWRDFARSVWPRSHLNYTRPQAAVTSLTENNETISFPHYIEEKEWADAKRMPLNEAREELETLTKEGKLQKMFRYDGSDSPVSFLVTEEMLDTSIRLLEIGDFGEDNDREIIISRMRTHTVYMPTK